MRPEEHTLLRLTHQHPFEASSRHMSTQLQTYRAANIPATALLVYTTLALFLTHHWFTGPSGEGARPRSPVHRWVSGGGPQIQPLHMLACRGTSSLSDRDSGLRPRRYPATELCRVTFRLILRLTVSRERSIPDNYSFFHPFQTNSYGVLRFLVRDKQVHLVRRGKFPMYPYPSIARNENHIPQSSS